jgi:DNA-binding NtrC family response regulator
VGESPTFLKALDDARKAAQADSSVLICGESGTGKELVARLIHAASTRREEPFVAVHCASLPESLMESELFGHEKGAFTSAERQKLGRFDLAGSGTLFFDEVAEMSLTTQVKLLRVLQEHEFMRVGGTQVIRTNARIVAASAKTLVDEVKAGRFRDDLYYRIGVIPIQLPPLRERPEDIPLLALHFLKYYRGRIDVATRDFAPEAMECFCRYAWPGNIRELRNCLESAVVMCKGSIITTDDLPATISSGSDEDSVKIPIGVSMDEAEKAIIKATLFHENGNKTRTAEILGIGRKTLHRKINEYGLN